MAGTVVLGLVGCKKEELIKVENKERVEKMDSPDDVFSDKINRLSKMTSPLDDKDGVLIYEPSKLYSPDIQRVISQKKEEGKAFTSEEYKRSLGKEEAQTKSNHDVISGNHWIQDDRFSRLYKFNHNDLTTSFNLFYYEGPNQLLDGGGQPLNKPYLSVGVSTVHISWDFNWSCFCQIRNVTPLTNKKACLVWKLGDSQPMLSGVLYGQADAKWGNEGMELYDNQFYYASGASYFNGEWQSGGVWFLK